MTSPHDPYHCLMPYPPAAVPNGDGPLTGLSLAVKDIYDVAGYRTGNGNPLALAMSEVKTRTCPAVQTLLDAGARFAAKTHTDELAWSMYGMNAHMGYVQNPAAPGHISGGSSSGSAAAVAGGLADIAIGSDTGGSVRAPASFCGVWGLRPSHGLIPLDGVMALAPSYDTAGLFARDGETLLRAHSVLQTDAAPLPATPRLFWPVEMMSQLGPEQRALCEGGFSGLEAAELTGLYPDGVEAVYQTFLTTVGADAKDAILPFIRSSGMPLVRGIRERAAAAEALTEAEVSAARAARAEYTAHLERLLGPDGVILAPACHDAPFRHDDPVEVFDTYRHHSQKLLCVAGLTGLPQVVFPGGRVNGAPFGLSLIGPRGSDLSLIRLAITLTHVENPA
ncbi:amidase [Poseidonocella sedimentorum]|uniref:Amidase n=1 Tax=Poseidonocella sedimentorum TaxID=871652 RepID=A0A1I6D7R2_9RHOB|nr:amidase [Poseidonocella sedimentorum]SFR01500.1 amidase [Poseidonocella sedimentorum]